MNNTETIASTTGAKSDNQAILVRLSPYARLQIKSILTAEDGVHLVIRGGGKVIIKLNHGDTYDIEKGKMNNRTLAWAISYQAFDIYADNLAAVIDELV